VDLSGIIFVVLALAWAFYLIPKAVKHHEDVARNRSVDRFSTAMRVLARREPMERGNARLVVTPARSAERVLLPPSRSGSPPEPTRSADKRRPSAAARRAAARAAARRRRHVLLGLVVLDLGIVTSSAFALTPWWSVAIPATLTVAYLFLCRRQVRREGEALWETSGEADIAPRRAIRVDAPTASRQEQHTGETEFADDEDTVAIPVAALETVAVSVETTDGGSLWDPLPVTLPTYVGKARATRSVRTIDLGAPGSWTSGRDEADTALVEQAAADDSVEAPAEQPRAVGS
jgi:hypothetical protein